MILSHFLIPIESDWICCDFGYRDYYIDFGIFFLIFFNWQLVDDIFFESCYFWGFVYCW